MNKSYLPLIFMIASTMLFSTQAIAQQTGSSGQHELRRSSDATIVIGKSVRNRQGVSLGKVENIILNPGGCVDYVVLSGNFQGAKARYYPVPWSALVESPDNSLVMDLDVALLRNAPALETITDATISQWRPRAHNYFYVEHRLPESGRESSLQMQERQNLTEQHRAVPEASKNLRSEGKTDREASVKADNKAQQQVKENKQESRSLERKQEFSSEKHPVEKSHKTDAATGGSLNKEALREGKAQRGSDDAGKKSDTRLNMGAQMPERMQMQPVGPPDHKTSETGPSSQIPDKPARQIGPKATTE